ncbi:MAG: AraC family transcriptional regulator [Hymenobacter sp.]|nr:MAG: AraC family transcriptional regulator [Hymenobacter sp.]
MCKTWHTGADAPSQFLHFFKKLVKEPAPLHDVIAAVQHHLRGVPDQKLNLAELAQRFALDKYQLIRHFKRQVGVTPNGYLIQLRIEQAKHLLAQGQALVEVALETGFYDQPHFARCFRTHAGVTPRNYQKSCASLGV